MKPTEPTGSPADAFATFARTRDPRAFAAAFDATAPALLLVATRLRVRRADAEDLLQDTWIHALRSADTFDARRPLLPWLVGILVHRVRARRRAERRAERRATAHGTHATSPDPISPPDAAALAEFATDTADAIQRLDDVHRQVLLLRLVHGLSSTEIGRLHSRAPHTVRSQLARALDKLRRLLPAGHALPAVVTTHVLDVPRIALVRTALLQTLPALAPLGLLAMKKVALVAALLVLTAFAVSHARTTDVPSVPSNADAPATVTAANARDVDTSIAPRVAVVSPPPASDVAPVAAPTRVAIVRGRCIDDIGAPIAGVAVTTEPTSSAAQAATDLNGRFEIAIALPSPRDGLLFLRHDAHVPLHAKLDDRLTDASNDVGDIVVPRAVTVHGTVRDASNAPRVGAFVWAQRRGALGDAGRRFAPHAPKYSAVSSTDGSFDLGPLPAGDHEFSIPGARLVAPGGVIRVSPPIASVDLVVPTAEVVSRMKGVVVDAATGAPIAGATLSVEHAVSPQSQARSGDDGTFALEIHAGATPMPFAIRVHSAASEPLVTDARFRGGESDVRLAVRSKRAISLRVRHDGGASGFELALSKADAPDSVTRHRLDAASSDRSLSLRLDRGRYRGTLAFHDAGTAFRHSFDLVVDDASPDTVVVEVPRASERTVVVRDVRGDPIVDADVVVVCADGRRDQTLATLRTDDAGECVARAIAHEALALRISANGHGPVRVQPFAIDGDAPCLVVLTDGATLRGRIAPLDVLDEWRAAGGSDERQAMRVTASDGDGGAVVNADGTFELTDLAAGTFDLRLIRHERMGAWHPYVARSEVLSRGITVRAGATTTVDVDVSQRRRGTLRGRLQFGGAPPGGVVALFRVGATDATQQVNVSAASDGTFTARLEAGTWTAAVMEHRGVLQFSWFPAAQQIEIVGGEVASQTFIVETVTATVRVVAADGRPAVGAPLRVTRDDGRGSAHVTAADRDGRVTIRATPGRYDVYSPRFDRPLATIDLPTTDVPTIPLK